MATTLAQDKEVVITAQPFKGRQGFITEIDYTAKKAKVKYGWNKEWWFCFSQLETRK